MIAGWYESTGYDFMILSEHNDHLYKKKIFCHDEVTKPGKFLILCGLELSETRHHTALGIDRFIAEEESLQDGVNKTLEAGGIPILNHPQAPVISASEFIKTEGLNHFEVFNGGRPKHTPPTEMLWDSILSAPNGRIVYAVASDDNHYSKSNVGKGWIMVNAPALTKDDIKENIRKGNFYATTGVILNDINTTRSKITIISKNGDTITFIEMYGKTLSTVSGNKATYRIKGDENYVRAKITNSEGEMAWTQPVKVK